MFNKSLEETLWRAYGSLMSFNEYFSVLHVALFTFIVFHFIVLNDTFYSPAVRTKQIYDKLVFYLFI